MNNNPSSSIDYDSLNKLYDLFKYGIDTNRKFIVSIVKENNIEFLKEKLSDKLKIIDTEYPGIVPKGYHYCKIFMPRTKSHNNER